MIPTWLSVLLDASAVGLTGLVVAGIAYAALAPGATSPGSRPAQRVGIPAAIVIGWVGLVFLLATTGALAARAPPSVPVIPFAIAVPILLGGWLLVASGRLRQIVE